MRITSWNVKGLRSSIKRLKILRHVKRLKTDIALLQETHLTHSDYHHMKKLWVDTVLGPDAIGQKARVIILIHKKLPCEVISIDLDNQSRFFTVHVHLGNRELVISKSMHPITPETFLWRPIYQTYEISSYSPSCRRGLQLHFSHDGRQIHP